MFFTLIKISVNIIALLLPLLDSSLMAESAFNSSFLHLPMCSLRNTYLLSIYFFKAIDRYRKCKVNEAWCLCGVSSHYYGRSRLLNIISVCADWPQMFRLGVEARDGRIQAKVWRCYGQCHVCVWTADCTLDGWSRGQMGGVMGHESRKVAWKSYFVTAGAAQYRSSNVCWLSRFHSQRGTSYKALWFLLCDISTQNFVECGERIRK